MDETKAKPPPTERELEAARKALAAALEDCRVGAVVALSREAKRLAKVARGMARPKP